MKNVTIVGVGALGSHLALALRNAAALKLCDFDRVEAKNILSQFHTNMGRGKNKAVALQATLLGLYGVVATAVPYRVVETNAAAVLGGSDLIVDCTDNYAARITIGDVATVSGIPCLHGGLSADGTFGRIMWAEHFTPDAEGVVGQATCEDGENLPFHLAVASQMALTVQAFLKSGAKRSYQMTPTSLLRLV